MIYYVILLLSSEYFLVNKGTFPNTNIYTQQPPKCCHWFLEKHESVYKVYIMKCFSTDGKFSHKIFENLETLRGSTLVSFCYHRHKCWSPNAHFKREVFQKTNKRWNIFIVFTLDSRKVHFVFLFCMHITTIVSKLIVIVLSQTAHMYFHVMVNDQCFCTDNWNNTRHKHTIYIHRQSAEWVHLESHNKNCKTILNECCMNCYIFTDL